MGAVYQSLEVLQLSEEDLHAEIPLGPEGVRHGTLDNGLKYYVRRCAKPKQRAAIALAVRVGSVVEEEGERGVAHILEHLAFNATENFTNHDIVSFLESIGASFGACQNALTSADETIYTLMVPTGDPDPGSTPQAAKGGSSGAEGAEGSTSSSSSLLTRSLEVMAEFAFRTRCAPQDLSKERGAVLEEWRAARDSAGRTQEAHWKLLLEGSRYAERLPIGLKSVITGVSAAVVKAFHRRWYQPGNMALVVVGDFPDPDAVVGDITRFMSAQPQDPAAPPVPRYAWTVHEDPRVCVYVDREAAESCVYASYMHDAAPSTTLADFQQHLTDTLFQLAFNQRLYRLSRLPDPPFYAANVSSEALCRAATLEVVSAITPERGTLRALECLLTELARVRMHGFSDREYERAVRMLQADIETTYLEADQGYCTDIRDEYVRHFLTGELVTGQAREAVLSKSLLPRISKRDVEERAGRFSHTCSAVFKTVEYRRHHTQAQLKAVVLAVAVAEAAGEILPWQELDTPDELMAAQPQVPTAWLAAHQAWQQEHPEEQQQQEEGSSPGTTAAAAGSQAKGKRRAAAGLATPSSHVHSGTCGCSTTSSSSGGPTPAAADAAGAGPGSSSEAADIAPSSQPQPQPPQQSDTGQPDTTAAAAAVAVASGLPPMVAPGVVSQRWYPQLGATELLLVNGMRVTVKTTDYFRDEVLITGVAPGGLSEVPQEAFLDGRMSTTIATQLGVFGHKPEVISEILAGKRCELGLSEGAYVRTFKGSASPADLREAAQLVHLLLTTRVVVVPSELGSVMAQVAQGIEAQERSPQFPYHNRVRAVNYGDCYFFQPITLEQLNEVDPYRAAAHHNASFQDPAEFTVIFTGNVTLEDLLPLVSTYLATIPPKGAEQPPPPQQQQSSHPAEDGPDTAEAATVAAASRKSTTGSALLHTGGSTISSASGGSGRASSGGGGWPHAVQPPRGLPPTSIKTLPWSFPDTPVVEDVQVSMVSPLTQSQITLPLLLARPAAREEMVWVSLISRLLETRLLQLLRFRFGMLYSVTCSPFFGMEAASSSGPHLRGDLAIAFTCDPANKAALVAAALEGLEVAQREGPTQQEVDTLRTLEVLEWENSLQENTFYHDIMAQGYQTRTWAETQDLDLVWARMVAARCAVLEALSPGTLHQALRRVLPCPPSSRYTAITMMPQPPGVLQRVAWAAQGLVARFTGGGPAAGAGAALGPSAAAGGQLASSGSLQHEAELAAAAAAAIGATSGQSWRMPGAGQQQQRVLVGAGVAAAAVAAIAALMLARSRR